jgi:hypothetical protein
MGKDGKDTEHEETHSHRFIVAVLVRQTFKTKAT